MTVQAFPLSNLRIQSRRFGAVEPRNTGRPGEGRRVSAEVLASTKERHPTCKCEDPRHMAKLGLHPLREGMPVLGGLCGQETSEGYIEGLGSGCTSGRWVCSRLDSVRRAYGK